MLLELWEELLKTPGVADLLSDIRATLPESDDQLDARVAYALGRLWLNDPDSVVLLGDADSGTFLVPCVPGIEEAFRSFVGGPPKNDAQADIALSLRAAE